MKIVMKNVSAGPEGVKHPGKEYDVSEKEGKELIEGGYAEKAVAAAKAPAPAVGTETEDEKGPGKKGPGKK